MFYTKEEMRKKRFKKFLYGLGCFLMVAVVEFILMYMLIVF